jgi:delta 1-pyrroline-5-carboxylate dehydrogenase
MTETLTHFIGGKQISAPGALESTNPSNTNEIIAKFPDGSVENVNDAVAAARSAFPGWSGSTPEVRADLLDKVGNMIIERKDALGKLLASEEGKTLPEATGETVRAGRIFKYMAGEALRRHGQNLDSVRPGVEIQTYREAVGVYGLITPWNFPIAIPAWKIAPALAFGNTVVLKSANPTPAVAHALVSIIHEAGAPAGIVNMVLGRGLVGDALAIRTSMVSPSPARRPWAPRSPRRRFRISPACRWKWAARIRLLFWTMRSSTAPSRSRWTAAILPPASAAPPQAACSCRKASMTSSLKALPPAPRR